ncbi:hypothetical protein Dimus_014358 [Dionaea muscipula]
MFSVLLLDRRHCQIPPTPSPLPLKPDSLQSAIAASLLQLDRRDSVLPSSIHRHFLDLFSYIPFSLFLFMVAEFGWGLDSVEGLGFKILVQFELVDRWIVSKFGCH